MLVMARRGVFVGVGSGTRGEEEEEEDEEGKCLRRELAYHWRSMDASKALERRGRIISSRHSSEVLGENSRNVSQAPLFAHRVK
jgi:hypothetical protein